MQSDEVLWHAGLLAVELLVQGGWGADCKRAWPAVPHDSLHALAQGWPNVCFKLPRNPIL